ncbi:aldo/keto reductase [Pseudonocardia nematodicida]|uniref:Aldo/keto reductase n=1 Tax=Pseudonocardia nematodicida TaxID=1206997 RepID=A0ABV1KAB7_9PSEU
MPLIGRSDLETFPVVLGGNTFGWTSDDAGSFAVLDAFTAAGGNHVDTADGYSHWVPGNSGGESEEVLGRWFARGNRDRVTLATKVSSHPGFTGLVPETISAAAEASLRRLGTDRIDLYYAHYDDPDTPIEESVAAFDALVRAGKVRHVGLSNFSPDRLEEWVAVATATGAAPPVAFQLHYNLLHRAGYEREFAPVAARHGIGVLPYFSLAAGLLTGKYTHAEQVAGTDRERQMKAYLHEATFDVVGALVEVADGLGAEPASVALAWLRTRPDVVAPVASARNPDQLAPLLAAADLELPADAVERLDRASDPAGADAGR